MLFSFFPFSPPISVDASRTMLTTTSYPSSRASQRNNAQRAPSHWRNHKVNISRGYQRRAIEIYPLSRHLHLAAADFSGGLTTTKKEHNNSTQPPVHSSTFQTGMSIWKCSKRNIDIISQLSVLYILFLFILSTSSNHQTNKTWKEMKMRKKHIDGNRAHTARLKVVRKIHTEKHKVYGSMSSHSQMIARQKDSVLKTKNIARIRIDCQ